MDSDDILVKSCTDGVVQSYCGSFVKLNNFMVIKYGPVAAVKRMDEVLKYVSELLDDTELMERLLEHRLPEEPKKELPEEHKSRVNQLDDLFKNVSFKS